MSHEPCTPVRHFEHSVKLMGAHVLLAGAEKVIGQQPLAQGNMAVLEDRANGHGELLPAPATLPDPIADMLVLLGRLRRQAIGVIDYTAMWAYGTIRPAEFFQVFPRRILIAKVLRQQD